MEPIFIIPYPEFCVAQELAKLLPEKEGYSLYVPVSRQQRGIDLLIAWRGKGRSRSATIQVKSSRAYPHRAPSARTKYGTRFLNFRCPPEAHFFCLVWFYPAENKTERQDHGTWCVPQILLFSQKEMRRFLGSVRTVRGDKRDSFFGFGLNRLGHAVQERGDSKRRSRDFSKHLLPRSVVKLSTFLST
jgi:hypothetical protein